jgi:hypothetical protein
MMDVPRPPAELDDEEAEAAALSAAIEAARSDPRAVPHGAMRAWLLKIAAGDFPAEPPTPRRL